jgi:hypothetical protein
MASGFRRFRRKTHPTILIDHISPEGGQRTVSQLPGDYLAEKEKANRRPATVKDIRMRIGKFARKRGYVKTHAAEAIEKISIDEHIPEVFTPKATITLTRTAEREFPRMVPYTTKV